MAVRARAPVVDPRTLVVDPRTLVVDQGEDAGLLKINMHIKSKINLRGLMGLGVAGLAGLRDDGGKDRVEVADDRVVRIRHDRRVTVVVDHHDVLARLAAGQVLGGPADPTGDVQVRRHLGAGLHFNTREFPGFAD